MTDAREEPQDTQGRLTRLENDVEALVEAVRALVEGLEPEPTTAAENHAARGARLARELLLTRGL